MSAFRCHFYDGGSLLPEQVEKYPRLPPPKANAGGNGADMLVPIEIDVEVEGGVRVTDRLLWDLTDGSADPTAVAQVKTLLAHECAESVILNVRSQSFGVFCERWSA